MYVTFLLLTYCIDVYVHVATCTGGDVRLIVSDDVDSFYSRETMYDSSYYDKDGLRVGRVEVCIGGRYGTVCYNGWDHLDASVVCRQLNLSPYGTNTTLSMYGLTPYSILRCHWSDC